METCITVKTPLRTDARWFVELRGKLSGEKVRWHRSFHVTLAYLCDDPGGVLVKDIIDRIVDGMEAPVLTFDKCETFVTRSADPSHRVHIISLTASVISLEFADFVRNLRKALEDAGCEIEPDFRLHVTLGEIPFVAVSHESLESIVQSVTIPSFSLSLSDMKYKIPGGQVIEEWKLPLR